MHLEFPSRFRFAENLVYLPEAPVPGLYATVLAKPPTSELLVFARWNGTRWVAAGPHTGLQAAGKQSWPDDLWVFDDGTGAAVYACGTFDANELGEPVRGVAKWTGEKWAPVGAGAGVDVIGQCRALAVFDDGRGPALYVGGTISEAGGRPVSNIARWDGDVWSDVGGGVWSSGVQPVTDMVVFDDGSGPALFVGGHLTHAGGLETWGVAKWTGDQWLPIAGRAISAAWVKSLAVHDDGTGPALYAAGIMGAIGRLRVQGIARWDGKTWTTVGATGGEPVIHVEDLAVFDDGSGAQLYASGGLGEWFGSDFTGLARWDGAQWHDMGRWDGLVIGGGAIAAHDDGSGPSLWFSSLSYSDPLFGRLRCVSPACAIADCDADGSTTFFDYLCFFNAYAAGDLGAADCDGDGSLAVLDFLCFQDAFAMGCP
ncbi:MAG: hypothetical protein ACF8R7_07125 [Phycisphaerales bacterium JB039]